MTCTVKSNMSMRAHPIIWSHNHQAMSCNRSSPAARAAVCQISAFRAAHGHVLSRWHVLCKRIYPCPLPSNGNSATTVGTYALQREQPLGKYRHLGHPRRPPGLAFAQMTPLGFAMGTFLPIAAAGLLRAPSAPAFFGTAGGVAFALAPAFVASGRPLAPAAMASRAPTKSSAPVAP